VFLVNKTRFRLDAISSVELRGGNTSQLNVVYR